MIAYCHIGIWKSNLRYLFLKLVTFLFPFASTMWLTYPASISIIGIQHRTIIFIVKWSPMLEHISGIIQPWSTVQVILCEKHSFLHQLTQNMKTNCRLNYELGKRKLQVQYKKTTSFVHVMYINWTCNSMNNLESYSALVS